MDKSLEHTKWMCKYHKKYVREQQLHDQMMDKVSVKELEDPFRG